MIVKLASASGIAIKKTHKGMLHKALGIPEGEPIPAEALIKAKQSEDPHIRRMANFALVARTKFKHKVN